MYTTHTQFVAEILYRKIGLANIQFNTFDRVLNELFVKRRNGYCTCFNINLLPGLLMEQLALMDQIFNPRLKYLKVERFGNVIVCTTLKTFEFLLFCGTRREQNYRNMRNPRISFNISTEVNTIHFRHHHITYN